MGCFASGEGETVIKVEIVDAGLCRGEDCGYVTDVVCGMWEGNEWGSAGH